MADTKPVVYCVKQTGPGSDPEDFCCIKPEKKEKKDKEKD